MDIGRAARYGTVGAIGVVLISLGTYGLMGMVWASRIAGSKGDARRTMMVVAVAGMGTAILFLFVVIGTFLDRELEARGLDTTEE